MPNNANIYLLSDFVQTSDAVCSALDRQLGTTVVCRNIFDLTQNLERTPAAAVLVDLDPHPMQMLQDIEPLTDQFSRTRFIALARTVSPELMNKAMEAGIRQCVAKDVIGTELAQIVKRLLPSQGSVSTAFGSAITVLSAGGGCGSTTLAVNLANELQLADHKAAMLIDLDNSYGAAAVYLGLKGQYGVADVLGNTGQLDSELIKSTAMHFSENYHVLISPCSVDYVNPKPLDYARLDRLMEVCKQDYRWVVVDAPRVPIDVAAKLAHLSKATFIVSQISVKDIRCARDMANALIEREVRPGSIHFVAGRYCKGRRMLTLEQAERALGGSQLDLLHNDFSSAIESINLGQTLDQSAPRSVLRHDVQVIAQSLMNPSKPMTSTTLAA